VKGDRNPGPEEPERCSCDEALALRVQLEQANGLWRHWCSCDITENEDEWAAFSDAVHDHLEGKPVPERFTREKRSR
jgi:hypothetical protein